MQQQFTLGTLFLVSAMIIAPSPVHADNEPAWSAAHEGSLLLASAGGIQALDFAPELQLVEKAEGVLKHYASEGAFGRPAPSWVREAKALFIVPETMTSSFEEYSEGANGILLVRNEKTEAWSQPAFYAIDQTRVTEQVGKDASALILIVRTQKGLEAFMRAIGFNIGSDATMEAGLKGSGTVVAAPTADLVGYAKKQGKLVGITLENVLVTVSVSGNEAYYGVRVKPDVVASGLSELKLQYPRSNGLRNAAAALTK
jgi:lipid-binding SYLF domain-containing protein